MLASFLAGITRSSMSTCERKEEEEEGYPLTCASFRPNGRVERNEGLDVFSPDPGRGINHRYYRGKLGFFGGLARARERFPIFLFLFFSRS